MLFWSDGPGVEKKHHKATALDVNDPIFAEELRRNAKCTLAVEEHEPIFVAVRYQGELVPRSDEASRWTPEFARHILKAASRTLRRRAENVALLAIHEGVNEEMWAIFVVETDDDEQPEAETQFHQEIRKQFKQMSQKEAER